MGIEIKINAVSTDELRNLLAGFNTFVREGAITECSVSAAAEPSYTQAPAAPVPQPAPPAPVPQQPTAPPTYTPQYPPTGDPQYAPPAYQPPAYQPPAAPTASPGYGQTPAYQQPPAAVPTSAQTYSEQQLAVAAMQLMDAGKQPELMQLLASFGVDAVTYLPKEQYGNFATQLRAMGAKI